MPDLGMCQGRIVLTDDGEVICERWAELQDALGEVVGRWQRSPAENDAIYRAAILDLTHRRK